MTELSTILTTTGTVLSKVLEFCEDILEFMVGNPYCQVVLAISLIGIVVITLRGIVSGAHFRG